MNITYCNSWVDFNDGELCIKLSRINYIIIYKTASSFTVKVSYHRSSCSTWSYNTEQEAEAMVRKFKVAAHLTDEDVGESDQAPKQLSTADELHEASERLANAAGASIGKPKKPTGRWVKENELYKGRDAIEEIGDDNGH